MSLLAIDPGETVGWAKFAGGRIINARKIAGGQMEWGAFQRELARAFGIVSVLDGDTHGADIRAAANSVFGDVHQIVIEDFLIYPKDVGPGPPPPWDPVITARLIGGIQLAADLAGVPVEYQGANIKSDALAAAAADDFARPLDDNRHENDATMHGTYYLARQLGSSLSFE